MVGKLRNEGMMIYENRTSKGVSYRVNYTSKAIIGGINNVFGKQVNTQHIIKIRRRETLNVFTFGFN